VECIAKPSTGGLEGFNELPEKVKNAAKAKVRPLVRRDPNVKVEAVQHTTDDRIVAIGSSTGGVEALITVLSRFPADCPPTVITQHMPPGFTRSFAERLNRLCQPTVAEAKDGAPLLSGHVYLAPGGEQHLEVVGAAQFRCRLQNGDTVNGHRPSVDVLFHSVAKVVGPRGVGAILTGMGRDGAQGLLAMREAGAMTVGQDEASCVVYGMPKVAFEIGAVQRQASLERIASALLSTSRMENA
jgi:two-component system, chemotaxis family, protein-glutamate methylesterase/glutaminase